jgi:hypothetical protein
VLSEIWRGFCQAHRGAHAPTLLEEDRLEIAPAGWPVTAAFESILDHAASDQKGTLAAEVAALPFRLWWISREADSHEGMAMAMGAIWSARTKFRRANNDELNYLWRMNFAEHGGGPLGSLRDDYRAIRGDNPSEAAMIHAIQVAMIVDNGSLVASAQALLSNDDEYASTALSLLSETRGNLWWLGRGLAERPDPGERVNGLVERRDRWLTNALLAYEGLVAILTYRGETTERTRAQISRELLEVVRPSSFEILFSALDDDQELRLARSWLSQIAEEMPSAIDDERRWFITFDLLPWLGWIAAVGRLSDQDWSDACEAARAIAREHPFVAPNMAMIEALSEGWPDDVVAGFDRLRGGGSEPAGC